MKIKTFKTANDLLREVAADYMAKQVGEFTQGIMIFAQTTPHANMKDLVPLFAKALAAAVALSPQSPNREIYEAIKKVAHDQLDEHADIVFAEFETAFTGLAGGVPN